MAIRRKACLVDEGLVSPQSILAFLTLDVPYLDSIVARSRNQLFAAVVVGNGPHALLVPLQRPFALVVSRVPHFQIVVMRARGELFLSLRIGANSIHGIVML